MDSEIGKAPLARLSQRLDPCLPNRPCSEAVLSLDIVPILRSMVHALAYQQAGDRRLEAVRMLLRPRETGIGSNVSVGPVQPRAGVSFPVLMKLLGHTSPDMTIRYYLQQSVM